MTTGRDEHPDDDRDYRFSMILQWPEQIGSAAWRKRAANELSSVEFETFLFSAGELEGLSPEERQTLSGEWEVFNRGRAKRHSRRKRIPAALEIVGGAAGIVSFCGVIWLVGFFLAPDLYQDRFLAGVLYFHLAVMAAYGVWLLVRLPETMRQMRAERSAGPTGYGRMKNKIVYLNGQYLPGELVPLSRDELALEKTAGWAFYVALAVFIIGLNAVLDASKGFMPLWLSGVLMLLGCLGLWLTVRLRDLAQRIQADLDRARAHKVEH